ncbi:MAG: ketoacyl-ACP synthase III [Mycobacteriaceae bacterium]|nr:ketoacyl-ACP synthase III [Mycobacteriaceae bacterium]
MPARIDTAVGAAHTQMLGLGVYRPERIVPNSEIVGPIDSSDEWIQTRSGIRARRFASGGRGSADPESVIGMATEAGRRALAASNLDADQIGAVVLATSSQMVLGPSAGAVVATNLGMSDTAAFDVSAGCAGFCYALANASHMVRAGIAQYVLVIGVERLTDLLDPTDRSCAFIFADGAGAVVVGPSEEEGIGPVAWGSDGSQTAAIKQDKDFQEFFAEVAEKGAEAGRPFIRMQGTAVFRWAATFLEKACRDALDKAGVSAEDLDVFVPHQANSRITDALVRVLKMPENVVVAKDIAEAGNTSAASIPLAMDQVLRTGGAQPGDTALLMGFGAGLAYAGQVVRLPRIAE